MKGWHHVKHRWVKQGWDIGEFRVIGDMAVCVDCGAVKKFLLRKQTPSPLHMGGSDVTVRKAANT